MESPPTSLDKLTTAFKNLGIQAPNLLTKIGILRSLFIEIESAKKYGYSYGLILETLIENGFKKTTLNQFYGLMNRIRLERGCANFVEKSEEKIAPVVPNLLDSSRRSEDLAPEKVNVVPELAPEQQESVEDDNPLIAMGIGTSQKKVASEPKVKLTFNKRNQVG